MTVEPASTRANRINSDSLDWSYIGISFTVGHSTSARRARGDPRLIHRLTRPDGRTWPALRQPGRVHLRGPPIAAAADAKLSGSRVVATDTSMALRAKRLSKSLADLAEANNCVAHIFSLGLPRSTGSKYRME
jgi:hypothetical protein